MKANTRLFGEIEILDDKLLTFEQGIIGFPDLKHFTLIFDAEDEEPSSIMWLQSMDDGDITFPVMVPTDLIPDYSPTVNEELLKSLGDLNPDNTYILVTVTVPKQIENITINLKAPFIINTDTNRGSQIIVEDDFAVRHHIYDLIKSKKAGE